MTLEELLFEINIHSDTGIYLEGKFRGSVATLMSLENLYHAYAHLEVDTITCDDVYTDNLKITLKKRVIKCCNYLKDTKQISL